MQGRRGNQFPQAALEWMAGSTGATVLDLGGSTVVPTSLAGMGHRVFAIDKRIDVATRLREVPGIEAIAAAPESLPFDPCQFDVVTCHQLFDRLAPGLVLSEMARVLRPGGCANVSFLTRDGSVPWVKRLVALLRQVDQNAMSSDFGVSSVEPLTTSKYFPQVERKSFRIWQQVEREALLRMVANQPGVAALDEELRQLVLDDAAALFDQSAPGTGPLRLPYELVVWRAWVDHEELTAPIEIAEDGLVIPL